MPTRVETSNPEGVDFAWVMQTTFVLTILLGAPIVALASIPVSLPTWAGRVSFAIRVGAIVWIVVAIGAFLYERRSAARREASNVRNEAAAIETRAQRANANGDGTAGRDADGNERNDTNAAETNRELASRSSHSSASAESSSET